MCETRLERKNEVVSDLIKTGMQTVLQGLQEELGLNTKDENFHDTPARVSRMYKEILAGVGHTDEKIDEILASAFLCKNDQLVLVKDIEVFSLCPHHLLPVHYKMHVAYLPGGKVIGISKLARIADIMAKRPVLQEQLVNDITEHLMRIPGVQGAACIAEGIHYCMVMRGIKQSQAKTITSSLRGVFLDGWVKNELLKLVFN